MTDVRHQVFISSTYLDLMEERSEAMQALLELECMPAGMELFPAANDTQWEWIKRVIDESDYYVVILAGRYGSISKDTGLSFTEMEYRYAVECGKPVVGFVHADLGGLPVKATETQLSRRKKLDDFRSLVQTRLCKFYSSPADLGAKLSRSITQLKKQYPKSGWVRADSISEIITSDDVLALRKENDELKARLNALAIETPKSQDRLAHGEDEVELDFVCIREVMNEETGRYRKHGELRATVLATWDGLFKRIGAELIAKDAQRWHPSNPIVAIIESIARLDLDGASPGERFTNFKVLTSSMNTVMMQLRALGLVSVSSENNWEITPYGDNYLTSLLGVPRGATRPRG